MKDLELAITAQMFIQADDELSALVASATKDQAAIDAAWVNVRSTASILLEAERSGKYSDSPLLKKVGEVFSANHALGGLLSRRKDYGKVPRQEVREAQRKARKTLQKLRQVVRTYLTNARAEMDKVPTTGNTESTVG